MSGLLSNSISSGEYNSIQNTNFAFFVAMNTPWASFNVHMSPYSKVNDGCNDIILMQAQNGGKCTMINLLTALDHGEYYAVNEDNEVTQNVPIDYIKASTWELRPRVKAPRPLSQN